MVTDADMSPSVREKFDDAVRFLFEGRMRTLVLVGTVAFPLVLGTGWLLTAGSRALFAQLIAVVPALFILGVVGAVGRHVLALATRGIDDASDLPGYAQLVREAPRFLLDFGALSAIFLAPCAVLAWVGAPLLALPWLVVAALLMPMATALRLSGSDWAQLKPARLFAAVWRTSPAYLGVSGVIALALAPATGMFLLTLEMPLFLMISVVGPLAVAPSFVAARMLGLTFHYERNGLADWLGAPAAWGAFEPAASEPVSVATVGDEFARE